MEKKEMNMERAKYIFVCGLIVVLAWQNSKLQDRVNMMESINADSYRQINQNSLILEDLMEQVPPEVERISRKIAREEGVKLFKQFSENLNKQSEQGR
tara:strand:- start:161 stop:454 length:294 start_codon:yes stop_codon:yes gene_type:complete